MPQQDRPDADLRGVWALKWTRVNGQQPRIERRLLVIDGGLLFLTDNHTFPYDYSTDETTTPKRIDATSSSRPFAFKAIFQVDGDRLMWCQTNHLLQSSTFPEDFVTVTGDQLMLYEFQRLPVSLDDAEMQSLPELLVSHFGPAPQRKSKEQKARLKEKRLARKNEERELVRQLASEIGEKYSGTDYAEVYRTEMSIKEQIPFAVFWLEAEVNNGGFYQYLRNGPGAIADDTRDLLSLIGAEETSQMLDKALALFPNGLPHREQAERLQQIETFSIEQHELLRGLNDQFYDRDEDLNVLAVKYLNTLEGNNGK